MYWEPYVWHHAMAMLFFMHLGCAHREFLTKKKYGIYATLVYIFMASIICYSGHSAPFFEHRFNVTYITLVPFIILAVSGTMMLFLFSSCIDNRLLQYCGQMSIVIFLTHGKIIDFFLLRWRNVIENNFDDYVTSGLMFFFIILVTAFLGCCFARILDTKYLRWTLGKM